MSIVNGEVQCYAGLSNEDNRVDEIERELSDLGLAAMSRYYSNSGLVNKFSMDNKEYREKNEKCKKAVLAYAGEQAGIKKFVTSTDIANAYSNDRFVTIKNTIVRDTILNVITETTPAQIAAMATVEEVPVGASFTWEIDTKGLPIAQRNSYTSNVAFEDGHSMSPITITPKVYSLGTSIDYIRILANNFDFGKEIARVAMGMLYAQYKLVANTIFSTALLTGTPLYQASFSATNYVQMISDLQMLNGGGDVKAYGTLPAFNAIGVIATTNYGFESQDEMIRNGYLGHAYGIDNICIDQATDLSAPFNTANATNLRMVPNNKVVLMSSVADRPVKLVREDFIHVKVKEPNVGSTYNASYDYFMSFDAAIATQAHYGIQGTTA